MFSLNYKDVSLDGVNVINLNRFMVGEEVSLENDYNVFSLGLYLI